MSDTNRLPPRPNRAAWIDDPDEKDHQLLMDTALNNVPGMLKNCKAFVLVALQEDGEPRIASAGPVTDQVALILAGGDKLFEHFAKIAEQDQMNKDGG